MGFQGRERLAAARAVQIAWRLHGPRYNCPDGADRHEWVWPLGSPAQLPTRLWRIVIPCLSRFDSRRACENVPLNRFDLVVADGAPRLTSENCLSATAR
jgi:hypothetical protein